MKDGHGLSRRIYSNPLRLVAEGRHSSDINCDIGTSSNADRIEFTAESNSATSTAPITQSAPQPSTSQAPFTLQCTTSSRAPHSPLNSTQPNSTDPTRRNTEPEQASNGSLERARGGGEREGDGRKGEGEGEEESSGDGEGGRGETNPNPMERAETGLQREGLFFISSLCSSFRQRALHSSLASTLTHCL
ncbi:hypothetical protein M758_9G031700 [Ceratodon purpureus]|nr:hypothetical protein M758_9G031700 [Ceratodon purpureus]